MYRSIVVPLDGSAFAEQALPLAAAIATRTGAALRLVRVWEPPYHFVTELAPPELTEPSDDERVAAAYVDRVAEGLRTSKALQVATAVLNGNVPAAILDNVTGASADLIVMTTHGRTGFSRAWLGSVADAIVRETLVPLLLHKPDETAGTGNDRTLERILIPLDGSSAAEQILPHAIELGRIFEAAYVLVSVVRPAVVPMHPYASVAPAWQADPAATERALAFADRYLRGQVQRVTSGHPGAVVEVDVRLEQSAGTAIVDAARDHRADVVALTTHARRGVRLLLGSVADKVLRGTDGSVLVLRPSS
jgi:nucleotide-binding universal stress UspA family protein